jgi:LPS-assembly protein
VLIAVAWLLPGAAFAQDAGVRLPDPLSSSLAKQKSAFPKQKLTPPARIDRAQPLFIQAEQLIYDKSRVIAQGNVEIYYNDYILTADKVTYDQTLNKLTAEGNAQLKSPDGKITRADVFEATDDFRDAFIRKLSVVTVDETRIAAETATRKEGNITEFERGKYTPCRNDPGMPPLWCIGAARIIHDQTAGTITYQDAQFQLFGVPILYLPYFQHPDPSVKRQSGFLMPSYDQSSTLGFSVEVPYYFALAPNYDFTFRPRYFTDRGVLWQGDYRHRLPDGQFTINFAAIADETGPGFDSALGNWRGSLQTKGLFSLSSWWKYGWDITIESDESFRRTYKLDPIIQTDRVNVAFLQGLSGRNYFGMSFYHFGGLYLNDTDLANSFVHPVIDYSYIWGNPVLGGELSFNMHARSLTRLDGTDSSRLVVEAGWQKKLIDPLGQVWTPFASARGDVYSFANAVDPNNGVAAIPDDTLVRGLGTAGVTYSYPFVSHTSWASHIVEPTAQIIVRSNRVDQFRTPDEDARSLVFDDTLLFDVSKFSGYDRLETGTRANIGLQYTLQTNGGLFARMVVGQSLHLAGENPYEPPPGLDSALISNFNPANGLDTTRSDYIAGLYLSPASGLSLIAQARFDEKDFTLRRQDTALQGTYGPLLTQFAYTYTQFDPKFGTFDEQQEIIGTLGLRLTERWSIVGQARYDIDALERVQDILQVKYSDECFVLSVSYIETHVENQALEIHKDRTVMLRFELKNLGGFTHRTDALSHIFGDMNQGKF